MGVKTTFILDEEIMERGRSLVRDRQFKSMNAFVEKAIRDELAVLEKEKIKRALQKANKDPLFLADIHEIEKAIRLVLVPAADALRVLAENIAPPLFPDHLHIPPGIRDDDALRPLERKAFLKGLLPLVGESRACGKRDEKEDDGGSVKRRARRTDFRSNPFHVHSPPISLSRKNPLF